MESDFKGIKMKPIVIAGSGPSFLKIDYSRLPRDFDVFRCNQFYLEDQYFLGKKIKGVFFNPQVFKEQYFTLHHLQERGEYEVEDVYCNWAFKDEENDWNGQFIELINCFPCIKNTYHYLEKLPHFLKEDRFYRVFYGRWATSGIVMLITAIAQGYKEIYLTGIDFYTGGGTDYAFEVKNKKIANLLPFNLKNYQSPVHNQEIDRAFIHLALKIKDIKLYAISPDTPLCELLPLAPIQREKDQFKILPKPQGYICDLIDLPSNDAKYAHSNLWVRKIKGILLEVNLYNQAKKNLFFILMNDFLFCLNVLVILIKKIRENKNKTLFKKGYRCAL